MRPNSSLVFDYVRNGNISGLLRSFQNSEASPFDHDEYGRSLLHVSVLSPSKSCAETCSKPILIRFMCSMLFKRKILI
jgi:hypothetical protein